GGSARPPTAPVRRGISRSSRRWSATRSRWRAGGRRSPGTSARNPTGKSAASAMFARRSREARSPRLPPPLVECPLRPRLLSEAETVDARDDDSTATHAAAVGSRFGILPAEFRLGSRAHRQSLGTDIGASAPTRRGNNKEARMRNVWIGSMAALALACSAGLAAQTTTPSTSSSTQSGQNTVTVTGCLQSAGASGGSTATGTAGTTTAGTSSTAGGSDRFMLANARMGSGASSRTGTSGTTATGSTAGTSTASAAGTTAGATAGSARGAGSSYTLDGNASELRRHVNHQVEITGRLDSSSSMGGGSRATETTTAGGTTAGAGATGAANASQTLRVESVKM